MDASVGYLKRCTKITNYCAIQYMDGYHIIYTVTDFSLLLTSRWVLPCSALNPFLWWIDGLSDSYCIFLLHIWSITNKMFCHQLSCFYDYALLIFCFCRVLAWTRWLAPYRTISWKSLWSEIHTSSHQSPPCKLYLIYSHSQQRYSTVPSSNFLNGDFDRMIQTSFLFVIETRRQAKSLIIRTHKKLIYRLTC